MQNMCSLFLMSIWMVTTGKQYITKQLSFVKTVHHFVYHKTAALEIVSHNHIWTNGS